MAIGKVFLIGAGPGDTGLITVRGLEILKRAETVLYDNLANSRLLDYCREDAEFIFVGKEAGKHYVPQEEIIDILIEKAKEGKNVARLKGGDPLIFGRGSEEAQKLNKEGIAFEIIPGVTAAAGATAYAGVPLTHRNMVTQCMFVTAHEAAGKKERQVNWQEIAVIKNITIVVYMGAKMLPHLVQKLIKYGMDPDTPAALIESGTLPCQKTGKGLLKNIHEVQKEGNFKPPLLTVIGPTAHFIDELNWYERKPFFGKRIVVTRAFDQAGSLIEMIKDAGGMPIHFPVIRTSVKDPGVSFRELFDKNNYDWAAFTSKNGVRWFFKLLEKENLDARIFGKTKIAAIGPGTADKLSQYGIKADFIPEQYTSSVFVEDMAAKEDIKGKKVLRLKGYFESDPFTDGLRKKGADVDAVEVYQLSSEQPREAQFQDITDHGADAVLFTSSSTVRNFMNIYGESRAKELFSKAYAVAIGPVTAKTLRKYEVEKMKMADIFNLEGLMDALYEIFGKK